MGRKKKKELLMTLRLPEEYEGELVASSREFIRRQLQSADYVGWSALQKKLFALVLYNINWKESGNNSEVEISNSEAEKFLGRELSEKRHLGHLLRDELTYMVGHSAICIQNPYTGHWDTENLLEGAHGDSLFTYVKINPVFMPHFEDLFRLAGETGQPFLAISVNDYMSCNSVYSQPLFLELVSCSPCNGKPNEHFITTRRMKDIMGLDKEAYMRKSGGFDRYNFEKKVLNPAVRDIAKTEKVSFIPFEDGQLYKKVKERGKVKGYLFHYICYETKQVIQRRSKKNTQQENDVIYVEYLASTIDESECD